MVFLRSPATILFFGLFIRLLVLVLGLENRLPPYKSERKTHITIELIWE